MASKPLFNAVQVKAVYDALEDLSLNLEKSRAEESRLNVAWERIKEQLVRLGRRKIQALLQLPEYQSFIDPATGQHNDEWRKAALDEALESDPEFMELWESQYRAQEAFFAARAKTLSFFDRLSATRSQARLMSASYEYLADSYESPLGT